MKEFKLGRDMVLFTLDTSFRSQLENGIKAEDKKKKSSYKVNKMDQEKERLWTKTVIVKKIDSYLYFIQYLYFI